MEIKLTNLAKFIAHSIQDIPSLSTRIQTSFWASDALKDPLELYWRMTGEPKTNPVDYVGQARMMFATAVEDGIKNNWLSKLGTQGLHLIGDQVYFGEKDPVPWSGKADFVFGVKNDKDLKPFVCEFKTTWGTGASMINSSLKPHDSYLGQIGLYLRSAWQRGITNKGVLLYYLISDDPKVFGTMISFVCVYDPNTEEVVCKYVSDSTGRHRRCSYRVSIRQILDEWSNVLYHVNKGEPPESKLNIKHVVTEEYLKELSDYKIKKILDYGTLDGDWQIAYSSYKDKYHKHFNVEFEYTPEEIEMFREEYMKRKPGSRKYKKETYYEEGE